MDDNVCFFINGKIRQSYYQIFLSVRDIDMVDSYCKIFSQQEIRNLYRDMQVNKTVCFYILKIKQLRLYL